MKKNFSTRRLCRAGIIAALYVALTWVFSGLAHNGFLQIRPAEALCILPLFFPEAVPALFVGCAVANVTSPFIIYDVPIGSATTLLASLGTYLIGRLALKDEVKIALGGLFPVVLNALIIPIIIVVLCGDLGESETVMGAYWFFAGSLAVTQAVWVYALGAPLYFTVKRLREKRIPFFL